MSKKSSNFAPVFENDRMDARENIVEKAKELFCKYGIKSVSMDDICKELGISKKTLYHYFDQKDDLVEETLTRSRAHVEEMFGRVMTDKKSVWEMIALLPDLLERMPDVRKVPPFFYDMNKYYPVLAKKHNALVYEQNLRMTSEFLKRGIEEKMFRDDLDVEVTAHFLSRIHADAISDVLSPPDYGLPLRRIVDSVTDLVLRSILSEEGMKKYEVIRRK